MFRCDCGNIKEIGIKNVERGSTKSCGCVSSLLQNNARHRYEHGFYGTRIYNIYHKMKTRCYNSSYSESRYYKDRGITICDEWMGKDGFKNFLIWSTSNGYNNDLTIDRINTNKGYSPENCRWVTQAENNRYKRNNVMIEFNGKTQCLKDWCNELEIPFGRAESRIKRLHWNPIDAITIPKKWEVTI